MRPFPVQREQYIEHFITMWKILNTDGLPFEDARLLELAVQTYERGFSASGSARQLAAILLSGSRKEGLMKVNVPSLVIHGDRDPLLPLECGIDIAKSIPGAAMKVIQGMGHALPPCIWDDIIDAFVLHAGTYG